MTLKTGYNTFSFLLFCILAISVSQITCRPASTSSEDQGNDENNFGQGEVEDHGGESKGEMPRVQRNAFLPPTIKNRVHGRTLRFHDGVHNRPHGPGYSSPIAKILAHNEAPQEEGEMMEAEQPTFTPYISARVFNMPQFLDHLKGNLESMTDSQEFLSNEMVDDQDLDRVGFNLDHVVINAGDEGLVLPAEQRGILRWRPAPMMGGGRSRSRNLLHFIDHNNKNAYEFGLG